MISFKGCHFPKHVILHAVYFYLRYSVALRDLEEILAERGVTVDHATLGRWVVKFAPLVAIEAHRRKKPGAASWRMDDTYLKVRGQWMYLYRAVDRDGKTLDFMLSERRDTAAAKKFFAKALANNGILCVSFSTRTEQMLLESAKSTRSQNDLVGQPKSPQ